MKMLKLLLVAIVALLAGCSAGAPDENVDSTQEAFTACTITGSSGLATLPPTNSTVIVGVHIADGFGGSKMRVSWYDQSTGQSSISSHNFGDVHWAPVNLTYWEAENINRPLRRVVTRAPGCQLSAPTKWCMDFQGDYDFGGTTLNPLQNATRFLSDVPITIGDIETPIGFGIGQITGSGRVWQMMYPNAAGTAILTKNWIFNSPTCP